MTNSEITQNVFEQIHKILSKSTCSNFKIIGSIYLDIRLILYFSDCREVYEWEYKSTEYTRFFTKDYDNHDQFIETLKEIDKQMDEDVPEVKNETV